MLLLLLLRLLLLLVLLVLLGLRWLRAGALAIFLDERIKCQYLTSSRETPFHSMYRAFQNTYGLRFGESTCNPMVSKLSQSKCASRISLR